MRESIGPFIIPLCTEAPDVEPQHRLSLPALSRCSVRAQMCLKQRGGVMKGQAVVLQTCAAS